MSNTIQWLHMIDAAAVMRCSSDRAGDHYRYRCRWAFTLMSRTIETVPRTSVQKKKERGYTSDATDSATSSKMNSTNTLRARAHVRRGAAAASQRWPRVAAIVAAPQSRATRRRRRRRRVAASRRPASNGVGSAVTAVWPGDDDDDETRPSLPSAARDARRELRATRAARAVLARARRARASQHPLSFHVGTTTTTWTALRSPRRLSCRRAAARDTTPPP